MRIGATPVPIPNTMVKTDTADNTWLETTWEDRWLPNFLKMILSVIRYKKCFLYVMADKAKRKHDIDCRAVVFVRTYLENFIQNQTRIILRDKNESRHQISSS